MPNLDPTEPTERSDFSEGFRRPEGFKDEYAKTRRVSSKSRDILSIDNGSQFDDASSEFGSEYAASHRPSAASHHIAHQEAKHVFWSKVLVGIVMLLSTALLGFFTYRFATTEEEDQFKNQFNDYADAIVDQSKNNAFSSFSVLESLSKTVTSLSLFANESWPLVSLPHFEIRASDYLDISGAQQIAFAPVVKDINREGWEAYTVANQGWIQDGLDLEYMLSLNQPAEPASLEEAQKEGSPEPKNETIAPGTNMAGFSSIGRATPIQETIWSYATHTNRPNPVQTKGPNVPLWQSYPAPRNSFVVNYNILSSPVFRELIDNTVVSGKAVLSDVIDNFVLFGNAQTIELDPKSVIIQPIFKSFEANTPVVGFLIVVIPWSIYFNDVLPKGADPVVCVLRNSCGESFTYEVEGVKATFLGEGDWHDPSFDKFEVRNNFAAFEDAADVDHHYALNHQVKSMCDFSLHVYPTQELQDAYKSATPIFITLAVVGIFAFTFCVFMLYDILVQRMQSKVVATALKTTAIVTSLFPEQVHQRLFETALGGMGGSHNNQSTKALQAPKHRLRNFLSDEEEQQQKQHGKKAGEDLSNHDAPIADLFPDCTVMFCDIAGFTAWSSVREPSQVFILLESVYAAFDEIAHRRKVFKVETIGDSYLAVAGLPSPRKDHALVMVRFAHDCLSKMKYLSQSLELELGPGTEDLTMRFGLHSGPVTAGVLRGEKTRFQLFGDTVNTASRMESTGERSLIQVSEETAMLLKASGKEKWLRPRQDKVKAKGKGELQTFWASPKYSGPESTNSGSEQSLGVESVASTRKLHASLAFKGELDAKRKRCVHWIAEIMIKLLKQIVSRRAARAGQFMLKLEQKLDHEDFSNHFTLEDSQLPIDEVREIITLPKFDKNVVKRQADYKTIKLSEDVLDQLHNYIAEIALLYHENPFHNFDHASHVTMSVSKLLARIIQPEAVEQTDNMKRKQFESLRHDHTYGITSDPLTQFAVVFSALIHDADHPGCPNATLVRDKTDLAVQYNNRSVAEQNSLDLSWNLLSSDKYTALRTCICASHDEMKRFRQLVVNSIIATDISDKTLSEKRKARWNIAFHAQASEGGSSFSERCSDVECSKAVLNATNRKATIVIEHIIQASDVAHTMQHWHIYTKWNEKLFQEMYKGYLEGKIEKDPAESWYQGEIGFFDFYIIPLAKKLKECGVFGVSSAEYLQYAIANRREWEMRGKEVVKGFVEKHVKQAAEEVAEEKKEEKEEVDFQLKALSVLK